MCLAMVHGVDGCCQTLKSFSSLYQHIYRNHKSSGIIQSRGGVLTPVITQTLESRSCDRQDGNPLSSLSQSTSDSSCDIPTGKYSVTLVSNVFYVLFVYRI